MSDSDNDNSKDKKRKEDARRAVLARRATFVAAALAGVSVACGKSSGPDVCLNVSAPRPSETTSPQPCLNMPNIPPEAGSFEDPATPDGGSGSDSAGTTAASKPSDAGSKPSSPNPTTPTVCLKIAPPPTSPKPCLTPVRPKTDGNGNSGGG